MAAATDTGHACRRWMLAALLAWAGAAMAAVVTIVDGEARIVDGQATKIAEEGLVIGGAALLMTSVATRLLRVEWPDGSTLDLGPDTQVLLVPDRLSERAPRQPGVYQLRGWVKVSSAHGSSGPVLVSPLIEVPASAGALVSLAERGHSSEFAETGSATLFDRVARSALTLPAGQFHARPVADKGELLPRPPAAFLQALPRAFRDTLPHRLAAVQGRATTPRLLPLPAYADLREWLDAEPAVRRLLVQHMAGWAQDPALRAALAARAGEYREWDGLLRGAGRAASAAR